MDGTKIELKNFLELSRVYFVSVKIDFESIEVTKSIKYSEIYGISDMDWLVFGQSCANILIENKINFLKPSGNIVFQAGVMVKGEIDGISYTPEIGEDIFTRIFDAFMNLTEQPKTQHF